MYANLFCRKFKSLPKKKKKKKSIHCPLNYNLIKKNPCDLDPGDMDPGDMDPGDLDPGDLDPGDRGSRARAQPPRVTKGLPWLYYGL